MRFEHEMFIAAEMLPDDVQVYKIIKTEETPGGQGPKMDKRERPVNDQSLSVQG